MKRLLLIVSFVASGLSVLHAQQDPQFSQFFLNKMHYNPGYAGTEEKICALISYRNQWLGFGGSKSGANPVTFVGSINAPLGNHFGVGLNIYNDQLGFEKSLIPTFSLSYRMRFSNGGILSPGVGFGFVQKSIAGDKLVPLETGDAKIPTGSVADQSMDINAGLYYYQPQLSIFDEFYASVSSTHLNKGQIEYSWPGGTYKHLMATHYYFMTGAEYRISNTLAVDPSIFVKSDLAKTSMDINAMLVYNMKFKGGLSYRTSNDISVLLGFKFSDDMQIGYSYDLTLNNLRTYNDGSHEIVFKYCFMPKFKPKPEKPLIPRLTPRFL